MGETSALACLDRRRHPDRHRRSGSWRTMAGVDARHDRRWRALFNVIGSATNPYFAVPFWWHMVAGGWAFGTVFMATDPVTAPFSERGQVDLRRADRRVRRADPRRQPRLSRIDDAGDPVHERGRAADRLRAREGQHPPPRRSAVPKTDSTRYTFLFATAVCVVCALLVAVSAVGLRERQETNAAPLPAEERAARRRPRQARRGAVATASSGGSSTRTSASAWSTSQTGELAARGQDRRQGPTTSARRATTRRRAAPRRRTTPRCRGCRTTAPSTS